MAKFLLDEQISPRVAEQARRRGIDVVAVAATTSTLAGRDDASILAFAIAEGRIVVTYDIADFVPLLAEFSRSGRTIPGVIFVDERSLPTSDIGRLVRALVALAREIEAGNVDASAGIFLSHR